MLTGITPFYPSSEQLDDCEEGDQQKLIRVIFENIIRGEFDWPYIPDEMSYNAHDIISKLLDGNPETRLGVNGNKSSLLHK